MKLTIDFETRSRVDLRKIGPWAYANDPSTEVMCLAVKEDAQKTQMWVRDKWKPLLVLAGIEYISLEMIERKMMRADVIEAHNLEFECAIWTGVLHARQDWPDIYRFIDKMCCSAARASACALPRALEQACSVLNLPIRKDIEGHALMLKMCKPRKPTKNDPSEWVETDAALIRLFQYCATDDDAEYALSAVLPELNATEKQVWHLDQLVNRRGIQIDLPFVNGMIEIVQAHSRKLLAEFQKTTENVVESPTQIEKLRVYIGEKFGVDVSDLTKNTVTWLLSRTDLNPIVRRLLEIRQSIGKTSVSKYYSLLESADADGRVRSLLMYHAAATGRWGGRRFQPQNLPREGIANYELLREIVTSDRPAEERAEMVEMLWHDPMIVASRALRNMVISAKGKVLYVGDFKSIEAIVTAWIAGEQKTLDAFVAGLDLYIIAAVDIVKKLYAAITKDERQLGKVAVLALGYQGSVGAFKTMAATYGVKPMEDKEIKGIVKRWREANPNIVRFWKQIEAAAIHAIKNSGETTEYNGIRFRVHGGFLCLRLPSGRVLRYFKPTVKTKLVEGENEDGTKYHFETEGIEYWGMDSMTNQWMPQETYGGKLTENIVQAISRDLLAHSMLNAEAAGYPIVLTVHDEDVAETDENFGDIKSFTAVITRLPDWAAGIPLMADSWKGNRYKK